MAASKYSAAAYTKHLYEVASSFEVDSSFPIKTYYRSGTEIERQARSYDREGNMEKAYILYTKFCVLFLEKIRKHPQFPQATPTDKARAKKLLKTVLQRVEELNKQLTATQQIKIDNYLKKKRDQEDREAAIRRKEEENQQLLIKEKEDNIAAATLDQVALFLAGHGGEVTQPPVMPSEAPSGPPEQAAVRDGIQSPGHINTGPPNTDYATAIDQPVPIEGVPTEGVPMDGVSDGQSSYPDLQPGEFDFYTGVPAVDRSTKPTENSLTTDIDWAGEGFRTVIVPSDVHREFLTRASSNTRKNVETCGILAGTLLQGSLQLTHIIIPKQFGTPDSCTTEKEEEIFEALDSKDLITLGWIHTHPSQNSFMSSIDLHTHCSYQLMMPEAISIVVAPKFDEVGFFTLTKPHGLQYISNCKKTGFHPHPKEPPLYEKCQHIKNDSSFSVQVIDLRN